MTAFCANCPVPKLCAGFGCQGAGFTQKAAAIGSFAIVEQFERRVAEFAGSKYAIATSTGTAALFLALKYKFMDYVNVPVTVLPARTFISVPMAVIQAGGTVEFDDYQWVSTYRLSPWWITDGALRFRRGMYEGGLHCLSFQARKLLNIGEGGPAAWREAYCVVFLAFGVTVDI